MITTMSGEMDGVPVESRLLVSHVPTSTESFDLRFGVMVKLFPGMSEEKKAYESGAFNPIPDHRLEG